MEAERSDCRVKSKGEEFRKPHRTGKEVKNLSDPVSGHQNSTCSDWSCFFVVFGWGVVGQRPKEAQFDASVDGLRYLRWASQTYLRRRGYEHLLGGGCLPFEGCMS